MKEGFNFEIKNKLGLGLLAIRLSTALVFTVWALDKIFVPEHATKVFSGFYGLDISNEISLFLGVAQLLLISVFVLGLWKNITYLGVFVFHAISTLSSFSKYLDPFNNLLFFAAWPMLAACFTLYLLREHDIYIFTGRVEKQPEEHKQIS